jgi:hypothetical protein
MIAVMQNARQRRLAEPRSAMHKCWPRSEATGAWSAEVLHDDFQLGGLDIASAVAEGHRLACVARNSRHRPAQRGEHRLEVCQGGRGGGGGRSGAVGRSNRIGQRVSALTHSASRLA